MKWIERREGNFLIADNGKILGIVLQGIGSSVHRAEVIYSGGGSHKNSLGDYIDEPSARAAIEKSVRELGLDVAAVAVGGKAP